MKHKTLDTSRLQSEGSIINVADALGVHIKKSGSGVWSMFDEHEETSLRLFEKTNTFKRFSGIEQGGCSKGDIICFVRHIKQCDFLNAIDWLMHQYPEFIK